MAFDGLFTHAMVHELNTTLAGGRVTKINQPYPLELLLVIRLIARIIPYYYPLIRLTRGFKLLKFHTKTQRSLQTIR